jgi:DNA-binding MarR family transcriptional regulator
MSIALEKIRGFRTSVRKFERSLNFHNCSDCPFGITFSQCHTIMEMQGKEPRALQDVSYVLNLDKSTVSRTVDNLFRKGYISRIIPENDRRSVNLSLTDEGRKVARNVNEVNDDFFSKALKVIPQKELDDFFRIFDMLAEEMDRLSKDFRLKNIHK